VQKSVIGAAEGDVATKTLKESMRIIKHSTINDFTVGWKV
jgi:hypothetical protein